MSNEKLIATDDPLNIALTRDARNTLAALVGEMIPASDEYGVPSASDPVIFADILNTAAAMLPLLGPAVEELDAGTDLVASLRASYADLVPPLVAIVAQCYYRDDRVMTSLGMEPRAPFPDGFDLEDGDWSLLDPVRERAKMYRRVDRPG
jgi:hypothetical protein